MGLIDVRGLLRHFPFRYEDLSRTVPLAGPTDAPVTVRVRIDQIRTRRSAQKRMLLTEATVSDEAGSAKVVWFRQPFIVKLLQPGDKVLLSGRLENRPWGLEMVNPAYEKASETPSVHTGRLVPIYPLAGSLTAKQLRALLHAALPAADAFDETLPVSVLDTHRLLALPEAIRKIHFPETMEEAEVADRRFRFEELLEFQLRGAWVRKSLETRTAPAVVFNEEATRRFVASLPFELTGDQKKAAWRILQDMASAKPMQRLVEGDVGSGKTAVAALVMHNAAETGFRSLLMAPTEILAEQHFATVSKFFRDTPHAVALRTRTSKAPIGDASVIIGTHALLNERLEGRPVGLVVVDEQHRFGVGQRHRLMELFAGVDGTVPHFLSMTATPIPRTLALVLYGDVDFTALRELPKGRKPVVTELVEGSRTRMYETIRKELTAGHKVFVVCPLIEPSDVSGAHSAEEEVERLRAEAFPDVEIGLLHGKMKADEKREVMDRFKNGPMGLLVSTTVVEVGVDVPAATVMVIEDADRFGMAQLHQLRGRVGRSDLPSRCFLVLSNGNPTVRERLTAFVRAKDCFELSELDLKFRGPGDMLGDDQSGFGDLKRFNPSDVAMIEETKKAAATLLEGDPDLSNLPLIRARIMTAAERIHLE